MLSRKEKLNKLFTEWKELHKKDEEYIADMNSGCENYAIKDIQQNAFHEDGMLDEDRYEKCDDKNSNPKVLFILKESNIGKSQIEKHVTELDDRVDQGTGNIKREKYLYKKIVICIFLFNRHAK